MLAQEGVVLLAQEGVVLLAQEGVVLLAQEGVVLFALYEGVALLVPDNTILSLYRLWYSLACSAECDLFGEELEGVAVLLALESMILVFRWCNLEGEGHETKKCVDLLIQKGVVLIVHEGVVLLIQEGVVQEGVVLLIQEGVVQEGVVLLIQEGVVQEGVVLLIQLGRCYEGVVQEGVFFFIQEVVVLLVREGALIDYAHANLNQFFSVTIFPTCSIKNCQFIAKIHN